MLSSFNPNGASSVCPSVHSISNWYSISSSSSTDANEYRMWLELRQIQPWNGTEEERGSGGCCRSEETWKTLKWNCNSIVEGNYANFHWCGKPFQSQLDDFLEVVFLLLVVSPINFTSQALTLFRFNYQQFHANYSCAAMQTHGGFSWIFIRLL